LPFFEIRRPFPHAGQRRRISRARGYEEEGESVRVGAWPVHFVPVFSPLTREAIDRLAGAHDLSDAWDRFTRRFLDDRD
jgi:hypothetical protein